MVGKRRALAINALLVSLTALDATYQCCGWYQSLHQKQLARIWFNTNPNPAGWGLLGQTEQPASAGHPTQPSYHINVIKLKWEVLWTGGLPVPHLHDNRPFKTIAFLPSSLPSSLSSLKLPFFCHLGNFTKLMSSYYGSYLLLAVWHCILWN